VIERGPNESRLTDRLQPRLVASHAIVSALVIVLSFLGATMVHARSEVTRERHALLQSEVKQLRALASSAAEEGSPSS
jgi:hypothetical protein